MVNYHISPKTGRSNICRAQEGTCPLKSSDGEKLPHFANKLDAKAYIEKTAREGNELLTSVSKPARKVPSYESWAEMQRKLDVDAFQAIGVNEDAFLDHEFELYGQLDGIYAKYDYPGCSGCGSDPDDYCRCARITGEVEINSLNAIAGQVLRKNAALDNYWIRELNGEIKVSRHEGKDIELSDEEAEPFVRAVETVAIALRKHGFDNPDNYEVNAIGGYYGDEVYSIELNSNAYSNFAEEMRGLVEEVNTQKTRLNGFTEGVKTYDDTVIAFLQEPKPSDGSFPKTVKMIVPNVKRLTDKKKLEIMGELWAFSGRDPKVWARASDEEKLRLANSRMGKYGSTEVTVKDDRIDWVNDSTMGNNYPIEDVKFYETK